MPAGTRCQLLWDWAEYDVEIHFLDTGYVDRSSWTAR